MTARSVTGIRLVASMNIWRKGRDALERKKRTSVSMACQFPTEWAGAEMSMDDPVW